MSEPKDASWPAEFSVGYLAKRAGMSRHQVLRIVKRIPALASLVHKGRWTKITLEDLQTAAPKLFNSIRLRTNLDAESESDDDY